jgi:hypothetical protein
MSDLDKFSRGIREAGERRAQEREDFNKKMGMPAHFVPDEDDPEHGVGYWKANGGVISYRKYSNGFDPNSRCEYSSVLIDILNEVK